MIPMSGVDAMHKLDSDLGYSLCGVDTYRSNLVADWDEVDCWECRAIADKWDDPNGKDLLDTLLEIGG